MTAQPLPELLDARALMAELGVNEATALRIMRHLDRIRVGRKVFVARADVRAWLLSQTESPDGLRRTA